MNVPISPIPAPPPLPPFMKPLSPEGMGFSSRNDNRGSEEPSRLVHQLPSLDVTEGRADVSVITGDWLARIAPVMRSLSPSAPAWWERVTNTSSEYYNRWLHADPLNKLEIKSEAVGVKLEFGTMARVEERGSILLLQALPSDLQTEAVSVRGLGSSALLFLTMCRYQPGGSSEKSMILSFLTQPVTEGSPGIVSNHAALRKWDRLFRRCRELGLQAPDPILLVRGLDTLSRVIHNKSSTAAFTLSTFRHKYQLDVTPTENTVLQYCQLLIAELENLSLGQEQKQQRLASLQYETPKTKPKGKGEGKGTTPTSGDRSTPGTQGPLNDQGVCKFFMSQGGCRYGRSCIHPHANLAPADSRCFNCGATGHTMKECDRPGKPPAKTPPPMPKMQANPRRDPPPEPKVQETPNSRNPKQGRRQPRNRKIEAGPENQTGDDSVAVDGEGIEKALKLISYKEPHMLASLAGITSGGETGLIDGGATHCLRFGAPHEFRLAKPVTVKLASGVADDLRISAVGTLLSADPGVQPIVPMGLIADRLGCVIVWQAKNCEITHPQLGPLQIHMCGGCPEVARDTCLALISELEEIRGEGMLKSLSVERVIPEVTLVGKGTAQLSYQRCLNQWVDHHFHRVPQRVRDRLVPELEAAKASGLNRHTRRRLERGEAFIHLFAGEQRWDHPCGTPSVALDIKRGYDLLDDGLFAYLLKIARSGKIRYLVGGPPCRTFTPLRSKGSEDGGPRTLRAREGEGRFGLEGLNDEESKLADNDAVLLLRMVLLAEAAEAGLREEAAGLAGDGMALFFMAEHPEDPKEYLSANSTRAGIAYPSIWAWPEIEEFACRQNLHLASFHQGMLGHDTVKPTKVLTSSGKLWEELHMLKVPKGDLWQPTQPSLLEDRMKQSATWGAWAPQLVLFLKQAMKEWSKGPVAIRKADAWRYAALEHLLATSESPWATDSAFRVCKSGVKRDDAFKVHCQAGHRPWRADCAACLDSMAFGRPHRRLRRSRACALAVDVSGPHHSEAEDQEVRNPKYFLVGAYTFPRFRPKLPGVVEDAPIPDLEESAGLLDEATADGTPEKWEYGVGEGCAKDLTTSERRRLEEDNKRWETIVKECRETNYDIVEIPFVEMLSTKSAHSIIGGLNRFYSRLRAWGLPVYRLHSDHAREFTHQSVRDWANHRGIYTTSTMPESKASNGRAERLIGRLKQQVRALLSAHSLEPAMWPHAIRYATEGRQREALQTLGHEVKPLIPFYTKTRFRSRTWTEEVWGTRSTEGHVVAPSTDVSQGYIVRVVDEGSVRFYATTLVYQDFRVPEASPDVVVDESDEVAPEVRPKRGEPGWPPPVGAGEVQMIPTVEAPAMISTVTCVERSAAALPCAIPETRVGETTTLRTIAKVSAETADISSMTLHDLESQALLLSYQPQGLLNACRISEVLDSWLTVRARVGQVEGDAVQVSFSHRDVAGVNDSISRLVQALVGNVLPIRTVGSCAVVRNGLWPSAVASMIADSTQEMVVVPVRPDTTVTVWVQLTQGDVVQDRVQLISPPTGSAFVAQAKVSLPGEGLHVPSGRLRQLALPPGVLCIVALSHGQSPGIPPVEPSVSPQSFAHKLDLWGETPLRAQQNEADIEGSALQAVQVPQPSQSFDGLRGYEQKTPELATNGGYWFERIPLPEVEPVTGELWDQLKADDAVDELGGVRLALLAAIRDQETAVARETQAGNMDLASLTAKSLAEAHVSLSKIEGILCDTQLNLSDLYEGEGPQNRDISLRAVDVGEKPDLLQAKVVPVSEVCANIDEWRDAIGDEVHSVITKHQAGSFRSEDAVREMEADPALEVLRVPGKLVAALKPPRRHKARLVACGNFLVREKCGRSSTLDRRDLYSAGLDVYSLRVQLCTGAHRLWKAASIDVRTAFLTAPYQPGRSKSEGKKKVVMVKVPRAVVLSGHAAPNTWIQVDKALYGLQESPHSWSLDRDQKMRCISWKGEDGNLRRLVQCMSDVSIWKIVDETGSLQGTIGVYVDDMLVMAADRELELAIQAIRRSGSARRPHMRTPMRV